MYTELIEKAKEAAQKSYSPYSHFRVGAAIRGQSGQIHTGTNVENRSYGLTCCAERNAVFAAIGQGEQKFTAVALCCLEADYPVPPCGACRQVLSEFMDEKTPIIYQGGSGPLVETTLGKLFPEDSLHELKKP